MRTMRLSGRVAHLTCTISTGRRATMPRFTSAKFDAHTQLMKAKRRVKTTHADITTVLHTASVCDLFSSARNRRRHLHLHTTRARSAAYTHSIDMCRRACVHIIMQVTVLPPRVRFARVFSNRIIVGHAQRTSRTLRRYPPRNADRRTPPSPAAGNCRLCVRNV